MDTWSSCEPSKSPRLGSYLADRSQLVAKLADLIKEQAALADTDPNWAPLDSHLSDKLLGEVAVWRAANGIDPSDPHPTGHRRLETMPSRWQHQLDRAIADSVASQRPSSPAKPLATKGISRRHRHRWVPDQTLRPSAPGR